MRKNSLQHQQRRPDVEIEDFVKVLQSDVLQVSVADDSGVVDQNIDFLAESFDGLRDDLFGCLWSLKVALNADCRAFGF